MLNVEKVLNRFGEVVTKNARNQLKRKNDTSKLYKSLGIKINKPQFKGAMPSLEFTWEDYGKFIDKGVRGAGGVRKTTSKYKSTNNKGKLWKIKGKNSEYKFGRSGGISAKHFTGWAKRKGISPHAVAKAVYHQGLETTHFFSRPFDNAFKYLPDAITEAYGDDLETFFKKSL